MANFQVASHGSGTATNKLTNSMATNIGTNRMHLVIINIYMKTDTIPDITGDVTITDSVSTYILTEDTNKTSEWYEEDSFYKYSKTWVYYALDDNIPPSGAGRITTVNFDGNFDYGFVSTFQINNAYQGELGEIGFNRVNNSAGPLNTTVFGTDVPGVIVGTGILIDVYDVNGGPRFYADDISGGVQFQTLSAMPSPWAVQHSNDFSGFTLASSDTETIVNAAWIHSISGLATEADCIISALEVRDEGWVEPTDGTGIYVSTYGCVNATATIFSGLDHLDGETVAILADGIPQAQQVVSSGSISISSAAAIVNVGLPYYSEIETLDVEIPIKDGTLQGRKVDIGNILLRFDKSQGGWIGPNKNHLYEAFTHERLSESSGTAVNPTDLFSGIVRAPLDAGYQHGRRFYFRQEDPLPVTISELVAELSVGG